MFAKVLWKSLLVTPAVLGAALISTSAIAAEVSNTSDSADALLSNDLSVSTELSESQVEAAAVVEAPVQLAATPTAESLVVPTGELSAEPNVAPSPAVSETQVPIQVAQAAPATDAPSLNQIMQYSNQGRNGSQSQVTSVSQLSDVQPTDWAFQALQNLVERYGCIAGYPDGTYRGQRAMTRFEFAAGMNACLDRINELIAAGLADAVTREDLATLQRLQEEFAAELATLRGRVDALEARTAELEANQFSTTTVLRGRTIFAVSDIFGDDVDEGNNTVFQSRVRLNFDTSFTGNDRLRARLQAGNFRNFDTPTATSNVIGGLTNDLDDQADFSFDSGGNNTFSLNRLEYFFPLGDQVTVYIGAAGEAINDIVTSVSPFDDPEQGSLSYFGYNPIYDIGAQDIGAGATVQFTDDIQLGFGYLTDEANSPEVGAGLFNGNYSAFGQLTFTPGDLTAALLYVNSYISPEVSDGVNAPTSINAYGISANYNLNDTIQIGGWVSYVDYRIFAGPAGGLGDGEEWTWAGTLGFSDLGKEGSLLGLIVGVPLRNAFFESAFGGSAIPDPNATLHIEGFYRYPLTDNISLTPGVIWLVDPGHNNDNSDIVIGVLRTTFSF